MDEMVVFTKPQLIAAINAGARDNFYDARVNPFTVTLGSTVYTFNAGLHERRSKTIIAQIRRTPAAAFNESARVHRGPV